MMAWDPRNLWAIEVDGEVVPCTADEHMAASINRLHQMHSGGEDPWRVARTEVDGAVVSTVFLGHNMGFGAVDLYYETMVFVDGEGDLLWRWPTRAEAEAGHEGVVAAVKLTGHGRAFDDEPPTEAAP